MDAIASTDLLIHLRRLLELAGTDQHAELATAVATVTAEFVATIR